MKRAGYAALLAAGLLLGSSDFALSQQNGTGTGTTGSTGTASSGTGSTGTGQRKKRRKRNKRNRNKRNRNKRNWQCRVFGRQPGWREEAQAS